MQNCEGHGVTLCPYVEFDLLAQHHPSVRMPFVRTAESDWQAIGRDPYAPKACALNAKLRD